MLADIIQSMCREMERFVDVALENSYRLNKEILAEQENEEGQPIRNQILKGDQL